jgi:hypothetical protein
MQQGNPANIVKPVRIVAHHTLNPTPPIMFRGRLIQQPIAPPPQSKGTIVWKEKKSGIDRPT